MNVKQVKCLELMALGEINQKEIAKLINISEKTICEWKKDPVFLNTLEEITRSNVRTLAPKALKTHDKLLTAKSEMIQYLAAKDVLDRAGYKADSKLKLEGSLEVKQDAIEEIAKNLKC